MAFDESLAQRARELLVESVGPGGFDERKMFGGLAFMVNTHMAWGLIGDDQMVRVGAAGHQEALTRGAREMDFTGRTTRGMVIVPGPDPRSRGRPAAVGRRQRHPRQVPTPKAPKRPMPVK